MTGAVATFAVALLSSMVWPNEDPDARDLDTTINFLSRENITLILYFFGIILVSIAMKYLLA